MHSPASQPVPALAGHSMTLVNDTVVIIGGMSSVSQYSSAVYMLESHGDELVWSELSNITGARPRGQSHGLLVYVRK